MGLLSSRFNRPTSGAIHSNGIASTGTDSFGTTSAETFDQRKSIDANRAHVQNFRHAGVLYTHRQQAFSARGQASITGVTSRSIARPGIVTRPSFTSPTRQSNPRQEPPSRGYNPYA